MKDKGIGSCDWTAKNVEGVINLRVAASGHKSFNKSSFNKIQTTSRRVSMCNTSDKPQRWLIDNPAKETIVNISQWIFLFFHLHPFCPLFFHFFFHFFFPWPFFGRRQPTSLFPFPLPFRISLFVLFFELVGYSRRKLDIMSIIASSSKAWGSQRRQLGKTSFKFWWILSTIK